MQQRNTWENRAGRKFYKYIFFSSQRKVPLWPRIGASEVSTTMVGLWMTVIHVGHYHDEGRVIHRLPVTLARSSKKQEAANHNTITLAENFSTTSQGGTLWGGRPPGWLYCIALPRLHEICSLRWQKVFQCVFPRWLEIQVSAKGKKES